MKVLDRIRRAFSRQTKSAPRVLSNKPVAHEIIPAQSGQQSRFGAITNRINRESWQYAQGLPINNDLSLNLASLQARSAFEYGTNPDFSGVCNTFAADVVGRDGPMLQVISENDRFNDAVEAVFREVFADPCPNHLYGGVEDMRTWVLGLLNAGSYYHVNTNVRRLGSRTTYGWKSIHARRFQTPSEFAGDKNVAFGCRYDAETGEPRKYYIANADHVAGFFTTSGDFQEVDAEAVTHVFIPIEAEQLTGAPLMSATLETAQDLRDLDKFVLESMKNAAANSPYLQTASPEKVIDPDPAPNGMRFEPGEVGVAPMGWSWQAAPATQPTAQYLPYKQEKMAELGRPIHMPLLVVLLTAGESNFSSAQYEGTVYADGIAAVQGTIQRRSMNRIVLQGVLPEVAIRRGIAVPAEFDLVWTWNVPANANIEKFAKAIRTMIEDGVISQSQGSALLGYDWEKVVASRKKCQQVLEEAELPLPPVNAGNGQAADAGSEDEEEPQPGGRKSADRFSLV